MRIYVRKRIHLIAAMFFIATIFFNACTWNEPDFSSESIPLDDSEYPYVGLPRLVIETENFAEILDREIEHPARLQIYAQSSPESDVKNLTIRGRGNSSFIMTKFGYKLEFEEKEELFGMPQNRDWDLVPNFRDKSFLRNYITYQLASDLHAPFSPKSHFIELFLNRQYLGVFQFTEHIKVAKNRVNIEESDSSFLVEKTTGTTTGASELDDTNEISFDKDDVLFTTSQGYIFKIKSPKKASEKSIELVQEHFNEFEKFIQSKGFKNISLDSLNKWIDVDDFIRYYWIQEFSKNLDGAFRRSFYMTWKKGDVIKMGPVWDFDIGYGLSSTNKISPEKWYIKNYGWYKYLMKNKAYANRVKNYWSENRDSFENVLTTIDSEASKLSPELKNEHKRWPVLGEDSYWPFIESYENYEEAIDSLKTWVRKRLIWIDENL